MNTATRIGVALAMLFAVSARADVFKSEYVNDNEFEFEIRHMPDLDQNRAGLGNNGQCHCVPTSTMNALIYIANHGFGQVDPGPGFWDDAGLYNLATAYIDTLGSPAFMDISWGQPPMDNNCGATASGGFSGLKKWLDPHGIFIVGDQASVFEYTPDFTFIAKSMINGSVGTLSYGKYQVQGDFKGIPIVRRVGGHVMTPIKFKADVNGRTLWVRDPDDGDNDITVQTPFNMSRMFTVTTMLVLEVDEDDNPLGLRSMDHLFTTIDDGVVKHRLIDGHRWIRLTQGYTLTNDGHNIIVLPPGGQDPLIIPSPTGNEIIALAPDMNGHDYYIVTAGSAGGPNTLHRVNTISGEVTFADTVIDAGPVTTSPGSIYVKCGTGVLCLPGPEYPRSGFLTTPPHPFEAMAHDDAAREVLLLSTTAFKLMRYVDLATTPTILDIPSVVAMGANPRMAVNPADGKVWVSSDASSTLYGLSEAVGGGPMLVEFLDHPLIVGPKGLDFGDRGHLFVATGGAIVELESIVGGGWQPVAAPLFGAAEASGLFHVARSRTTATARHDSPAWANIPHGERVVIGELVQDCYADLDGDGQVGIFEFLLVLSAWGPCDDNCAADFDQDGEIGITEFLFVLSEWGPCP